MTCYTAYLALDEDFYHSVHSQKRKFIWHTDRQSKVIFGSTAMTGNTRRFLNMRHLLEKSFCNQYFSESGRIYILSELFENSFKKLNLGHCVSHFLISSVSIDSQFSPWQSPIIYCAIVTILFCSLMINVLLDDFVVALIAKTSFQIDFHCDICS